MHPRTVRKFLLRYAETFALGANPGTEALEVPLTHGLHVVDVTSIGLQLMSIQA